MLESRGIRVVLNIMKSKNSQLKIQAHKNHQRFLVPQFSRGQLKIQEMAFMLVAVILFFVLVGLFASSIIYKNLKESATDIEEEKTLSAISNLAGTAEFVCTGNRPNCIDEDKLMALIGKRSYENYWPFTSLKVVKYSGFNKKEEDFVRCNMQNYHDCDVIEVFDKNLNENVIHSFVALCGVEFEQNSYEKCEIAQLLAGSERK